MRIKVPPKRFQKLLAVFKRDALYIAIIMFALFYSAGLLIMLLVAGEWDA